ncbi:hypothetical protein ACFY1A_48920, partial [Streptomyces sp. NPDC001520]
SACSSRCSATAPSTNPEPHASLDERHRGTPPLLEGVTGRYFEDCNEAELNTDPNPYADSGVRPYALDTDNAKRLWDLGTAMLHS